MPADTSIDHGWLMSRLAELNMTQRNVADRTGINRSTVNRLFKGDRDWKSHHIREIADIMQVTTNELMIHIGAKPLKASPDSLALVGIADEKGAIAPPKAGQPRRAERPDKNEFTSRTAAVRVQAPGRAWDGWICYFVPAERIALESVGRLCVVELKNKGGKWLGTLQRGYSAAVWNLFHLDGSAIAEGVDVLSASPVVWIRT